MGPILPTQVTNAVDAFQSANWVQFLVALLVFSALLVAARGPAALKLSDETLRSVIVTLALALANGVCALWLVISVDPGATPFGTIGLPAVTTSIWSTLPWPLTVLLVLLALDFCDYWSHRLMHNSPLWGVHAVHHSEQRMTWISSFRVHFLEANVMRFGYFVLLGWIGLPAAPLAVAFAISLLHNHYVHCDVGWDHGPLDKLIASPNWHRWHHSVDPTAYNQNYANVFSLFDVMFGTYYNPGRCDTEVGLDELPNPGVINLLAYPATYLLTDVRDRKGAASVALLRESEPQQPIESRRDAA